MLFGAGVAQACCVWCRISHRSGLNPSGIDSYCRSPI